MIPEIKEGMDLVWVSQSTYLVFIMQIGFAFLEAGTLRNKNLSSVLMKNMLDTMICGCIWWAFGYSFAFGTDVVDFGFIGSTYKLYALQIDGTKNIFSHFLFSWAFAGNCSTIVSGCVAERMPIVGYFLFSIFMSSIIYPIACHWVWGGGWLGKHFTIQSTLALTEYHDFAGVSVVHMVGGLAGLVATVYIRPRTGRFYETNKNIPQLEIQKLNKQIQEEFKPQNPSLVVQGTLLLWFGWYGFNCGSTMAAEYQKNSTLIGYIGVTTTLSACCGGITLYVLFCGQTTEQVTIKVTMGILSGLVAITGGCDVVEPWAAIVIGVVSGIWYEFFSRVLLKYKIDDPLDASSIHFACGLWGMVATGLFAKEKGVIYKDANMLAHNVRGVFAIITWVSGTSLLMMAILNIFGLVRISQYQEKIGMDYDTEEIELLQEKEEIIIYSENQQLMQQNTQVPAKNIFELTPIQENETEIKHNTQPQNINISFQQQNTINNNSFNNQSYNSQQNENNSDNQQNYKTVGQNNSDEIGQKSNFDAHSIDDKISYSVRKSIPTKTDSETQRKRKHQDKKKNCTPSGQKLEKSRVQYLIENEKSFEIPKNQEEFKDFKKEKQQRQPKLPIHPTER